MLPSFAELQVVPAAWQVPAKRVYPVAHAVQVVAFVQVVQPGEHAPQTVLAFATQALCVKVPDAQVEQAVQLDWPADEV